MNHEARCDAAAGEIERMAAVVRGAALDTPVPTCGQWTLADLVEHTGEVHRWATRLVEVEAQARIPSSEMGLVMPQAGSDYADWLAAGAGPLVAAFRHGDPDAPMWAWGADQHVRFWPRRMLHETTVHRVDAELALGLAPSIDAGVAADGIDEFLDNLPRAASFAPEVAELRGHGESLRFHAVDEGVQWRVVLAPDGFTWDHGAGDALVAVTGAAADLLLLAYGRYRPDDSRFSVAGDEAVLAHWLAHSAI